MTERVNVRADELQAGPELDGLVGEKAMGLTPLGKGWFGCVEWGAFPHLAPSYSTRRYLAFDVAERLRADGFSLKLYQPGRDLIEGTGSDYTVVSLVCPAGPCPKHGNERHNHHGAYNVSAPTLPLAICRAALIALGAADAPSEGP